MNTRMPQHSHRNRSVRSIIQLSGNRKCAGRCASVVWILCLLLLDSSLAAVQSGITKIAVSNDNVHLEWTGGGSLQWAPAPNGPWTTIPNVTSPCVRPLPSSSKGFYRIQQTSSASAPILQGPSQANAGTPFSLTWTYSWPGLFGSTADGYELQGSTSSSTSGFATLLNTRNKSDRQSPKTFLATASTSGAHWYRVRAWNRIAWTAWSDVVRVDVAATLPAVVRINNDLFDGMYLTDDWSKYNSILRLRIGPSESEVINNSTLDRLWPYNSTSFIENTREIRTGDYQDFNVRNSGPDYYIYVQTGYWHLFWNGYSTSWHKNFTSVMACDGQYYDGNKWTVIRVTSHSSGVFQINLSEFLPHLHWYGSQFCN